MFFIPACQECEMTHTPGHQAQCGVWTAPCQAGIIGWSAQNAAFRWRRGDIYGERHMDKTAACDFCDEGTVREEILTENFHYGCGGDQVVLSAKVPVITCDSCGLAVTDWRGEDLRSEAVRVHLERLAAAA